MLDSCEVLEWLSEEHVVERFTLLHLAWILRFDHEGLDCILAVSQLDLLGFNLFQGFLNLFLLNVKQVESLLSSHRSRLLASLQSLRQA